MEKSRKKTNNFTREQKAARRKRQVRRQMILLITLPVFLLSICIGMFLASRKPDGQELKYINEACESYRPQVEKAAAEYGMSDYVDLILALMMQESSGIGPDVLQSSEGAYNTKYPQKPGGIKDVSYSIQCGIQELKYALEKAGVQGPTDIENIKLALQAYNFGADVYFSFMEKQGETLWTRQSAEAFAQMASGKTERAKDDPLRDPAGPWAYGDQRYPEHVLQYYHPPAEEIGK